MRNLKKFLALVLAMMMAFSLMITANASFTADSDFSDAESLTPEFREAVSVLEGLEVFEGYEDGTFKPKNNITRAEVATIVYRLATGDVKGVQANLYKDYATFSDVKADHWAAGYINYCANAEWIAGYGNGKFGPSDQVTGYQAASMILRAVGYGKNKEFVGSGWQVQTANFSRTLGLLVNVDDTTYANTLNQAAPRELVAEILFQAGLINTVTWTQLEGYKAGSTVQGAAYDGWGLAWQNFKLDVGDWDVIDDWGRPGYYWYKNNAAGTLAPVTSGTNANVVATVGLEPELEFDSAWKECDVAHELDISTTANYDLYVNNDQPITTSTIKYMIDATDTVTNVGGQGRITEFYKGQAHPWNKLYNKSGSTLTRRVVMVDTYLATVTNVTERVLDPAGHVIVPAYLYLDVYDGHAVGASNKLANYNLGTTARNTSEHRASKSTANWEYAKGDKVLVQGYTDYRQGNVPGANVNNLNHNDPTTANVKDVTAVNRAAFETNILRAAGTNYVNEAYSDARYDNGAWVNLNVLQKADYKTGKQTVTYWNKGMHTVDGNDWNDQMTLFLDVAGTTTNTTYAWYFDTKGNIIGIDNVPDTVNFGVITSIYSSFGQGESATDGTAKAVATVLYADGTTATVNIDRFLVNNVGTGTGGHATANTAMTDPGAGTLVSGNKLGTNALVAELIPVYDYNVTGSNVMSGSDRTVTATTRVNNASIAGWLHVAPVATINAAQDKNGAPQFGVIRGNMFKFVASTDGNVTAIEVAGNGTNNGIYTNHGNKTVPAGNVSKLYKNLSYIDLTNTTSVTAGQNADVRLDDDTRIMVRAGSTSTTVNTYTLDTLPGDVALVSGSEVDWADTDNDGRAEYVYVTGTSEGTLTYGLFYYNGGAAQWNGTERNGTLFGWLNGEPTTLTFIGQNSFNAVKNSQTYSGHLFAVQLTNGVVTAVMEDNTNATNRPWLVVDNTTVAGALTTFGTNIVSPTGAISTFTFKTGVEGGNSYTANTGAVYLRDAKGVNNIAYNAATRTVVSWLDDGDDVMSATEYQAAVSAGTVYYLNGTSKVIGLGMGVNQESAILDYLNKSTTNDVTIVYEQSGVKSIVEIYVATDPNVTPPTVGNLTLSGVSMVGSTISYTVNNNYSAAVIPTVTVEKRIAGTTAWTVETTATLSSIVAGGSTSSSYAVTGVAGSAQTYEVRLVVSYTDPVTSGTVNVTSSVYTAII